MITTAPNTETTETVTNTDTFCIDSETSANWLLRKLAAIDSERALIKAQTVKRDAELKADADRLMHLFGDQLRAWAREEATRRRRQGVTLLFGTLSFRSQPARLMVKSEADALTTAKAILPDTVTVETVERFDKEAYLTYATAQFEETGELITGIDRTEAGESFSVVFRNGKGT